MLVGSKGEIIDIITVTMNGHFTPLTSSGTIMINNIYSSCYASFPHQLTHLAFLPARIFPRIFLDNEETLQQDGIRTYAAALKMIGKGLGLRMKVEEKGGNMKVGEILFVGINIVVFTAWSKKIIHL